MKKYSEKIQSRKLRKSSWEMKLREKIFNRKKLFKSERETMQVKSSRNESLRRNNQQKNSPSSKRKRWCESSKIKFLRNTRYFVKVEKIYSGKSVRYSKKLTYVSSRKMEVRKKYSARKNSSTPGGKLCESSRKESSRKNIQQ